MIKFEKTPTETMVANHAPPPSEPSPLLNVQPTIDLLSSPDLHFRDKVYKAPPIPFEDGLRLIQLASKLEEIEDENPVLAVRSLNEGIRDLMIFCWSLLKPKWYPRFIWMRRNPFLKATMQEVRQILDFFGRHRQT